MEISTFCWIIVTRLKRQHSDIRRIYVRTKSEADDPFKDATLMYDDSILLDAVRYAGMLAESVRNRAMVDMCDILVTYLNAKNLQISRIKSVAEIAIECADENKKRIVNLFER